MNVVTECRLTVEHDDPMKAVSLSRIFVFVCILMTSVIGMQSPMAACRKVSINSSGDFSFQAARIIAIAPGSGGLKDVADFVIITPPAARMDGRLYDVEKILVVPGVERIQQPNCRIYPGESSQGTVSCISSLPTTNLNLIAKFKPTTSGYLEYLDETKEIILDISKNVLGCEKQGTDHH